MESRQHGRDHLAAPLQHFSRGLGHLGGFGALAAGSVLELLVAFGHLMFRTLLAGSMDATESAGVDFAG